MPRNIVTNWDQVPVLMDVNMAARIMGQSPENIKRKCRNGEFPAYKECGEWRIEKELLQKYIRSKCVMPEIITFINSDEAAS